MSIWQKKESDKIDGRNLEPIGNKLGVPNALPTLKQLGDLRNSFKEHSSFQQGDVTKDKVLQNAVLAGELNGYNQRLRLFTRTQQLVRRNALGVMKTSLQEMQSVYQDTLSLEQTVNQFAQKAGVTFSQIDVNRADHKGNKTYWSDEYDKIIDW